MRAYMTLLASGLCASFIAAAFAVDGAPRHVYVVNTGDGSVSLVDTGIFAVQVLASAKKDDAGTRSIALVTRSGATESDGATEALSTTYIYYRDLREVDPNTGAAWTKTNLNAAEFGVKVAG